MAADVPRENNLGPSHSSWRMRDSQVCALSPQGVIGKCKRIPKTCFRCDGGTGWNPRVLLVESQRSNGQNERSRLSKRNWDQSSGIDRQNARLLTRLSANSKRYSQTGWPETAPWHRKQHHCTYVYGRELPTSATLSQTQIPRK